MPHILIYGDSNTHGSMPMMEPGDYGRFPHKDRWTTHLAAELGEDWHLTVEGLGGRTTVFEDAMGHWRNGLRGLPAVLHSHKPLDGLAIMLGTNDLKMRMNAPACDIADGMAQLVVEARRHIPWLPVLAICPPAVRAEGLMAETYEGAEIRGAALPGHFDRIGREYGCHVADAGAFIQTAPGEGVHFTAEAHAQLGRALAPAFRALPD